jgi:phage N-6-adenine-methyltransferase
MPRTRIHKTNAARQAAYRRRKKRSIHFSSQSCEWSTPPGTFALLDAEFHFELDVCANADNAKCARFYTKEDDGLKQSWEGVCWMNPPYGLQIRHWIQKAYESSLQGATVVCLIPSRTDTRYWHDYIMGKAEVRYIKGRLKFGGVKNSAPFPSAVVIFRPMSCAQYADIPVHGHRQLSQVLYQDV